MASRDLLTVAALVALAGASGAPAASLDEQVAAARAAAAPFWDYRVARDAGWRPFGGDEPLMGQHWYHPDGPDYVSGGPFDPARPSNLMYARIGGTMQLVALSYNVRIAPGEPVPDGFSGSRDAWHAHDFDAALDAALQDRPLLGWLAQGWFEREIADRDGKTRLAMVHLWLMPNPDGRFASHNRLLAYMDLGLPTAWAEGASMAAARGLALASDTGCEDALSGQFWVANVGGAQERGLMETCAGIAAWVREGLLQGRAEANRRGERAWAQLEAELDARLTGTQKARIAAMTEHGEHDGHH